MCQEDNCPFTSPSWPGSQIVDSWFHRGLGEFWWTADMSQSISSFIKKEHAGWWTLQKCWSTLLQLLTSVLPFIWHAFNVKPKRSIGMLFVHHEGIASYLGALTDGIALLGSLNCFAFSRSADVLFGCCMSVDILVVPFFESRACEGAPEQVALHTPWVSSAVWALPASWLAAWRSYQALTPDAK